MLFKVGIFLFPLGGACSDIMHHFDYSVLLLGLEWINLHRFVSVGCCMKIYSVIHRSVFAILYVFSIIINKRK